MPNKDMSFLPEDYLEARIARRTNAICLMLFVVVMAGVIGAFFVTDRQRSEVRALQRNVSTAFEDAARRLEQLDQLQRRKHEMLHKAQVTSVLLERQPRTLILAELVNNMPATLSLLELELDTRILRNTGPRPMTAIDRAKQNARTAAQPPELETPQTEVTLKLVGVAPTDVEVAQFMTAIGRHPLFIDVNLGYSEAITLENQPMRKFAIDMKVDQQTDTAQIEPTLVKRELNQNPMGSQIQINAEGKLVVPTEPVRPVGDRSRR